MYCTIYCLLKEEKYFEYNISHFRYVFTCYVTEEKRKVPAISSVRLICFLPHDGRIKTVTCQSSSMCNRHYHKLLRVHWWSITSMVHEVYDEERIISKNNYNTCYYRHVVISPSVQCQSHNIFPISWLVGINFVLIWDLCVHNFNCLAVLLKTNRFEV
jgi:hypothetical protein